MTHIEVSLTDVATKVEPRRRLLTESLEGGVHIALDQSGLSSQVQFFRDLGLSSRRPSERSRIHTERRASASSSSTNGRRSGAT